MTDALRNAALVALAGFALHVLSDGLVQAQDLYGPRTDWESFTRGDLNISGFVFRDVDRDGVYGPDDRPMEDIAMTMISPQGRKLVRWSNSNGFVNFSMSATDTNADIADPGDYQFVLELPDNWHLTTDNAVQTKSFKVLTGAVADMVADPPFYPVGIAPDLFIRGFFPAELSKDAKLIAVSPTGQRDVVATHAKGSFEIPVKPGDWTLEVSGRNGTPTRHSVSVGNTPVFLSKSALLSPDLPESGRTVTVDFEDITEKNIREMPSNIANLNWWNVVVLGVSPSYTNNATSGHFIGYNSSGHPARIYRDRPFHFMGGYFGVAWRRAHGETVVLRGWRKGQLKYEDTVPLSYLGPSWFLAKYMNIDRIDIKTEHYWQVVMDDLMFITDGVGLADSE